jgi:hypothetical protein
MSRIYTVSFDVDAATTADDFLELDAAAEKPITVLGWYLSQSTELGDAAEEGIRYAWVRGNTTSGSGGSTATPRPCNLTDAAAGFTCETNNTTPASSGTAVQLFAGAWNLRNPDLVWLPDGCGFVTSGATLLCCRLLAAPTDSTSFAITAWVLEDG